MRVSILAVLISLLPLISQGQEGIITLPLQDKPLPGKDYFLPYKEIKRRRVGLALSGGGARGIAQIGVLKVFEREGIPIDCIVGSSIGSIVGGLYAAGYSADQILQIAQGIDWDEILIDRPRRIDLFLAQKEERDRYLFQIRFHGFKPHVPSALTPGQKLSSILTDLTMRASHWTSSDFDSLKIPFRAVATDLISGRKIVIGEGDLVEAMLASCSVPLLFSPVERDSMLLVDGGLVDNIPVDVTREQGVDIVIAVDTSSKLRKREELSAPWEVADQVAGIMQRERNKAQGAKADILLRPDLNDRLPTDFRNLEEVFQAGIREAEAKVEDIKRLIFSHREDDLDQNRVILPTSVQIKGTHLPQVFAKIRVRPGQPCCIRKVLSDLEGIYRTGFFSDVKAIIEDKGDATILTYLLKENPILKRIKIQGNTILPDSSILNCMKTKIGDVINHHQSQQDLRAIIDLYRQKGYSLAHIKEVDFDYSKGMLTITIDEGRISEIKIEGNRKTRDYVILREFPLRAGDVFNFFLAKEGITNIYSTGLFDRAQLIVSWRSPSPSLTIKLAEKESTLLKVSARYDLERGARGFLEFSDENLLGSGNKMTFHTQYGKRDQVFALQFRADRLFKTYLTYNLSLYHRKSRHFTFYKGREVGEYGEARKGIILSVGEQVKKFGTLSLEGRMERVQLKGIYGLGYPTEVTHLRSLRFKSIVDTQDQIPFPTRGKYYLFYYEISGKYIGSEVSFFKILSSLEFFYTFGKYHTWHPKFLWGTSDLTTPFYEQFRIGGDHSFFGLREEELVGRRVILGSLEYRFHLPIKIALPSYLSIRYDLGGIWKNSMAKINPRDFHSGWGVSLSFATPLGPLFLSYGQTDTGQGRFYLSAGCRF